MSVMMSDLSWDEYQRRIEDEGAVVLLPVGAVEQHGYHLPLGTDWMMATYMARRAAENIGGVVAAPITYGYRSQIRTGGGPHQGGTTNLDGMTLINLVKDVLKELARHGARKIAVIDGEIDEVFRRHALVGRTLQVVGGIVEAMGPRGNPVETGLEVIGAIGQKL